MKKVYCGIFTPIECINPVQNKYKIRCGYVPPTDESMGYCYEHDFDHAPELSEIKEVINAYYNAECSEVILKGYKYGDYTVWLTLENQTNYRAYRETTVQSNGDNLPIRVKVCYNGVDAYIFLRSIAEVKNFYDGAVKHIADTLNKYWDIKDAIDWNIYTIN